MTLEDLARTLPNGFHDAEVSRLAIDFASRLATFDLEVWIGDMDCPPHHGREMYRRGRLRLTGLGYFVMDVPGHSYGFRRRGAICIDSCESDSTRGLPPLEGDEFGARLWVNEWNAFIHLSATQAEIHWLGEPYDRGA
jgi:hypothetical protein